ncbi:MAG: uncharacterized protein JWQ11_3620, partial [Rhizobacter sp.]|nr:uncharacterized protein [Rhizobacter sp.]
MADASLRFLSFVRRGFSASITQPDSFGSAQAAIASATVGVQVGGVAQPVTHAATVRGPGDVVGIAANQVVRTDPVAGAVGVEPNYFAQIEFDRPDLPWLFTPAAAAGERLRPWIVLVVLDAEGPNACRVVQGTPLPRFHVPAQAAADLPDLATSYLWAHAQVITPDGQDVAAALKGDPRLSVSRLLCPRHLQPERWYVAAVVPAFAVGRLAGLGLPVTSDDEAKLEPAWQPGAAVDLPVFHCWTLRTGQDEDFESLARKLQGRPLPPGVGSRSLDVGRPGAGLPGLPVPADVSDTRAIAWLGGALRAIDDDALPPRDAAATTTFRQTLTVLLDRPADIARDGAADPVVAPPIYGDQHALVVRVDQAGAPPWLSELNLDPAHRVAAGLGTQVVQARQDDYVARAWRQLGDVMAANRLLRTAQLARSGSLAVHARLSRLPAESSLSIAFPARDRLLGVAADRVTLGKAVALSRLPDVATEPAFRRMTRPASAMAKAAGASTLGSTAVKRFAADVFAAPHTELDGVSSMRPASEVVGAARASEVLRAVGDADPDTSTRLDTMLATLTASAFAFPTADVVRAMPLRTDTGAVSMLASLGAVSATALSALLDAAVTPVVPAAPPAAPPQAPPSGPGPIGPIGPTHPILVDPVHTIGPAVPATPLHPTITPAPLKPSVGAATSPAIGLASKTAASAASTTSASTAATASTASTA